MRIRSRGLYAAFQALISAAALYGVAVQTGVFTGKLDLSVLNYYTLMRNLLCAAYFALGAVKTARDGGTLWPHFKGALVMVITVTGLVYHFMLSDGTFSMQNTVAVSNVLLHYIVPAASVLSWLLFDAKGRYRLSDPPKWLLLPNLYFVYAVVRVALGGVLGRDGARYPYPFIDADVLGWGRTMLNVVALNACFIALGSV